MEEIWKDVVGYEGLYQVSNMGRVYSLPKEWVSGNNSIQKHKGKILMASKNSSGYYIVDLRKNNKRKSKKIHQLVAESFLGHIPCGYDLVIDHINDNPLDNRLENLQIVTHRFNIYKTRGKYSSQYKGVTWNKKSKKWRGYINFNGRENHLGLFENEYDAHLAYQEALKKHESMKQNQ